MHCQACSRGNASLFFASGMDQGYDEWSSKIFIQYKFPLADRTSSGPIRSTHTIPNNRSDFSPSLIFGTVDLVFDDVRTSHVFDGLVIGMAQTTVPSSDIRDALRNESVMFDEIRHGSKRVKAVGIQSS